jgi:hypothetical protein
MTSRYGMWLQVYTVTSRKWLVLQLVAWALVYQFFTLEIILLRNGTKVASDLDELFVFCGDSQKDIDYYEDLNIDRWILIKWIFKK